MPGAFPRSPGPAAGAEGFWGCWQLWGWGRWSGHRGTALLQSKCSGGGDKKQYQADNVPQSWAPTAPVQAGDSLPVGVSGWLAMRELPSRLFAHQGPAVGVPWVALPCRRIPEPLPRNFSHFTSQTLGRIFYFFLHGNPHFWLSPWSLFPHP